MDDREHSVQYFLDLIKKSHRGKFKVYIGMIAGVGKSYRMLQEAHELLENGVNVQIGYIETHGRAGTEALLQGLPVIPRRKIFYKGKELEEMDLDTIIRVHPEIVIVDELAHTNVEGSLNEKRWLLVSVSPCCLTKVVSRNSTCLFNTVVQTSVSRKLNI